MNSDTHSQGMPGHKQLKFLSTASHIAGLALGGVCGVLTGAVIGVIGGPIGIVTGAMAGGLAGVIAGDTLAEGIVELLDTE